MSKTLSEQVAELEPERRGEVIAPENLRVGDVVDIYGAGTGRLIWDDSTVSRVEPERICFQGDSLTFEPFFWRGYEFRLVSPRFEPEPELPTERGSVILVTEFEGEKLDEPVYVVADSDGDWWAHFGGVFPDGSDLAKPYEITGWKPARIVVED